MSNVKETPFRKPIIAFIGVDGSGKTSLIKEVVKNLRKSDYKSKIVYMGLGRDHHIPFLGSLMQFYARLVYGEGVEKRDYHKSRDNYRPRGVFWLFVQYFEFWIRYLKAKRFSKEHFIFFDRFFYDGLILSSPLGFKIFRHLTPKPDLCFLISAPTKTIRKRKREAEINQIEKYYKGAKELSIYFPIVKINNTQAIKKVGREIFERIRENG